MPRRAVLFDVGGPIDMEFAREIALDGAIASACGLEGIRIDQAAIEEASEKAVVAFAPDAHVHMIETLCGDPRTVERVRQRVQAMTGNLDVFQLRPDIDGLLRKLRKAGLTLAVAEAERERIERAGLGDLFVYGDPGVPPADCIVVADRLDRDIAPAKALGMATIRFRTGRYRKQKPRSPAETPDAEVTDVAGLEAAILELCPASIGSDPASS
ncbi:MAG: HAD hydrolase-like protein [Reyranella sp.]|uniref:HAD family hydrolase n=1 Tax=Reyranella sp. TaxID=1929291 RepID=UPI001AC7497E|nr:HAD hydrolase-like protein [Reyranella sp.]MBN9087607.1 HAD hydrolase-like protein [Reyranella sp.]